MAKTITDKLAKVAFLFITFISTGSAFALGDDAFPNALGFGVDANGWRGGKVINVTSLADSGKGTLRACAEGGPAARVCVFKVSGTIALNSSIRVGANVYIAGQTAPGGGIQLRLAQSQASPLLIKNTNNVLIRYLKSRPGPSPQPSASVDGVTIEDSTDVYLDHMSIAFATDENVNIHVSSGVSTNITIANSIIAYGLNHANHPDGSHSKGMLICSSEGSGNSCGRISVLRNLISHNRDRNPDIKGTSIGPIEFLNNIIYDPISQFGEFYNQLGATSVNYIGNVALSGPSTINQTPEAVQAFNSVPANQFKIFVRDNKALKRRQCNRVTRFAVLNAAAKEARVTRAIRPLATRAMTSTDAFVSVLSVAGDRLPTGGHLDSLDIKILNNVQNCTGSVIDSVLEAGGWPNPAAGTAPKDSDGDGLPDTYEASNPNLNPNQASNVWATDPTSGWSHLETYLSLLAGDFVTQ
ncbi:hypothetical protein [Actibacterium lipolyticum]|nr:hypothetical protein [Actibacterium lipolyticum]